MAIQNVNTVTAKSDNHETVNTATARAEQILSACNGATEARAKYAKLGLDSLEVEALISAKFPRGREFTNTLKDNFAFCVENRAKLSDEMLGKVYRAFLDNRATRNTEKE
jgi:hypothetical protein